MDDRIRPLVETLWQYHQLNHQLSRADAILVLCSYDRFVAERGAGLFLDGWAPLLIFSGGLGSITKRLWAEPEADLFAKIAIGMGVPEEKILIENRSTNTGENILLTKRLLAERRLDPQSFIVVQKPYMERRSYATFKKLWPGKDVLVTSPRVSLDEYLARHAHPASRWRARCGGARRRARLIRVGDRSRRAGAGYRELQGALCRAGAADERSRPRVCLSGRPGR